MNLKINTAGLAGFESQEEEVIIDSQAQIEKDAAEAAAEELRLQGGQVTEEEEEEGKKPKGTPGEEEEEEEGDTVVSNIINTFGIDTGKKYENTQEGLSNYSLDIKEAIRQQSVEEENTRMPLLKALREHLEEGRSLDTFMRKSEAIDYSAIRLNEEDDNQLKEVITQGYKSKGLDNRLITRLIKTSEEEGVLYEDAKEALKDLGDFQANQLKEEEESELTRVGEMKKESEKTWKLVEEKVNSGKLLNFNIPPTEKKQFLEFIGTADRSGKTELSKKWEALDMEQRLTIDYMIYKGLKLPVIPGTPTSAPKATLGAGSRMFANAETKQVGGHANDLAGALKKFTFGQNH